MKDGEAADPYPGASRVVPPRLHIDLGVTSKCLKIHTTEIRKQGDRKYWEEQITAIKAKQLKLKQKFNFSKKYNEIKDWQKLKDNQNFQNYSLNHINKQMTSLNEKYASKYNEWNEQKQQTDLCRQKMLLVRPNIYIQHKNKMNKYGIYRNRYFSSLEGNQCKKYRMNWEAITNHFANSLYYQKHKPFMKDLNSLFKIMAQSKPVLAKEEGAQLEKLVKSLHQKWLAAKETIDSKPSMPPKYHYFDHGAQFCNLWDLPLGFCDEGGLEHGHKIYNMLRREYLNQRGIKRVQGMMGKMYLITAPKYIFK
eukprot:439486_1